MTAPKNAGSLTAGLLARKGAAQPAMRRQTVTGLGPRAVAPLDDLGWNDMGEEAPPPSPVAIHIAAIQETLDRRRADRRAEPDAATPATPASGEPLSAHPASAQPIPVQPAIISPVTAIHARPGHEGRGRSAFTLRIDADRHLRLRLLSAMTNRSAQQLLTGALDALIAAHPEIDALAAHAPVRPGGGDTATDEGDRT